MKWLRVDTLRQVKVHGQGQEKIVVMVKRNQS